MKFNVITAALALLLMAAFPARGDDGDGGTLLLRLKGPEGGLVKLDVYAQKKLVCRIDATLSDPPPVRSCPLSTAIPNLTESLMVLGSIKINEMQTFFVLANFEDDEESPDSITLVDLDKIARNL